MTAQDELDPRVPDELPLLRALVDGWAGRSDRLHGVSAVLIQHQLGSMVPTVRTLFELGLDQKRT
jgi:hypothetical protein